MKFFETTKGSISIFLILVLLPLYTCLYLAIDSARWSAAKTKLSGAMNLTGTAALHTYDRALKDRYGLFAMGLDTASMETEMGRLFSGTAESADQENMIHTAVKRFDLAYKDESVLARPSVLEKTITNYMKYRGPYNAAFGVAEKVGLFRQASQAAAVMEKSTDYYEAVGGVTKKLEKISDRVSQTREQALASFEQARNAAQEAAVSAEEGTEVPVVPTYDAEGQKAVIQALQAELGGLQKAAEKTAAASASWKTAIDGMEAGEAKALLAGDYKESAETLSGKGVAALEQALDADLAALNSWTEGEEPPVLTYLNDPLYQYISAAARTEASAEETSAAHAVKDGLSTLAGTDIRQFIDLSDISVSALCGGEAARIDELGSAEALEGAAEASGARALLKNVRGSLSSFSGSTDSVLSDCFVEEYLNGMFSCYTDPATGCSLSNHVFSESPLFRCETEYILFGRDNGRQNVVLAAELIFSIRFLLNALYVFSNARMRTEAMSMAAAISGLTGAGIVLVQNLILTAWAMAESVVDVSTLLKGGRIPIYKNAATWTLGISGIAGKLQEGAANLMADKIDDIFEQIQNTAEDQMDSLSSSAMNYLEQSSEGAVESLTNMVVSPVESAVTMLIGDRTRGLAGTTRDQVSAMIMSAVDRADNGSRGFSMARSLFEQYCLGPLTDQLFGNYQDLFAEDNALAKQAAQAVENTIRDCYTILFNQLKADVGKVTSGAKAKLDAALQTAQDKVKAETLKALEDYTGELSKLLGKESAPATTAVSSYSGMAMSYRDYLKLFTVMGVIRKSGKTGMLTRAAKIMQIGCAKDENGFRMTRCFTEVRLNAALGIALHTVEEEEVYRY